MERRPDPVPPDPVTLRRLALLEERVAEMRRVLGVEDPEHEAEERRTVIARIRALEAASAALEDAAHQENRQP